MESRLHSRRRFVRNAATGLFVPSLMTSVLRGSTPLPLGFWKSSAASVDCTVSMSAPATTALNDWVSRVQGRGSDVTGSGVQTAVGTCINCLMSDGIWSRGYRIGVYCGDALAALEAPLLNTYGSTTDTMFGFVGGDYSATGLVGGAGKHIKTGFTISMGLGDLNDLSIGFYGRTGVAGTVMPMGVANYPSFSDCCLLVFVPGRAQVQMWQNPTIIDAVDATDGRGFYVANRSASNDLRLYKNGSQLGSTSTSPGTTTSPGEFFVHDAYLNDGGTNWLPYLGSGCFYWIGKSLDATQQANLYTRVQTLQTTLGRQV